MARLDPGGEQRVALQVQDLRAVGLRDAHVAEPHVTLTLDALIGIGVVDASRDQGGDEIAGEDLCCRDWL